MFKIHFPNHSITKLYKPRKGKAQNWVWALYPNYLAGSQEVRSIILNPEERRVKSYPLRCLRVFSLCLFFQSALMSHRVRLVFGWHWNWTTFLRETCQLHYVVKVLRPIYYSKEASAQITFLHLCVCKVPMARVCWFSMLGMGSLETQPIPGIFSVIPPSDYSCSIPPVRQSA